MKIATYNINGINNRLPVLLRWLKEAKPDIVCLQELKAETSAFPKVAISRGVPEKIAKETAKNIVERMQKKLKKNAERK